MLPAMSRTWLITGASRGLGRAFTEAALARGDRVAALARNVDDLPDDAVPVRVDVTDRAAVFAAVEAATEALGTLDVVVNNAGTMSIGMVEEFDEAAARAAMETNFFGALWVSQAVAPRLRAQRSGHLVHISSIGGLGGHPSTGLYSASKFALEGLAEALAAELRVVRREVDDRRAGRLLDRALHAHADDGAARGLRAATDGAGARVVRRLDRQRPGAGRRGAARRSSTPTTRRCGWCSAAPSSTWRSSSPSAGSRPGRPGKA